MFNNKSILVTGGTGSFGYQFVETILKKYKPKKLIIFSRDEFKQHEMKKKFPEEKYKFIRYFIGDVRDYNRLEYALKGVDYAVHAAALKQVDVAEYNPMEVIKTNILGSQNFMEACVKNEVTKVIALSTDKAANPISLYGATKLCSDKLFIAGNNIAGKIKTRFAVVRYGNILKSRGSVVTIFSELIKNKSKFLPVTDKRMTRYWLSIEEGVEFVIKSFQRMLGGEIFIPKIPSVRITDLCKAMAPKLPIKIIGLRPGEKIHEILCPMDSAPHTLSFADHYVIKPDIIFFDRKENFNLNNLGEKGKSVDIDFDYNSGNNPDFLSIKDIIKTL
tara:strand:- start:964 stop:1959 length:996 start_codon:yes stop_codon:yes gene_type:complete